MEKLLDILNQYVELKLMVVNHKPYVISHQDQPEEYEGQLYLFTLTPPNNINFNDSLYNLFSDSRVLRAKANLCASSIEFCATPSDEDELNKIVAIFENILEGYRTLSESSKKQQVAPKVEEPTFFYPVQEVSPPASPLLSLSEPIAPLIISPQSEPLSDSPQHQLLSSLSVWSNTIDWETYSDETDPPNAELMKEKLYNCLIKLKELLNGRTESPKGFFAKSKQYLKNNANYYTNSSSAMRIKEDIEEYTQPTVKFSVQDLKSIVEILNTRLNHVKESKEHQIEVTTLKCALDYANQLIAAEKSDLVLNSRHSPSF